MCGGGNLLKTIAEVALPVVGDILAPEIGIPATLGAAAGGAGAGLLGGGGLQGALEGGALSGLGAGITNNLGSITNAVGLDSLGATDASGPSLSDFTSGSGLSSFLGGTPQPTSDLSSINLGTTPNPDATAAATNPVNFAPGGASASYTAGAAAPGSAGAGGGTLAGFSGSPDTIGEGSALGSSQGAAPTGGFNYDISGNAATPEQLGAGAGIGGTPPSGIGNTLSNLLSPSENTGAFNYDINGSPAGASSYSIPQQFANASGGNGMDLSSLLGGGGSSSPSGGSTSMLNGLLKGGLGYLLNNNNSSGLKSIQNATNSAQANFAPYLQAGNQAESTLSNLYGNNGTAAQTAAQQGFQNTPGYQFALNQGLNAVNANNAATGQINSGNAEEAINNYAQGTASQQYNNYVNQLQNMASGGLSAAGGSGTAGLTGAGARAQLGQNNANNLNTAIGTGLNSLFPTQLNLQQLLGTGGAGGSGGLLAALGLGS